MGGTLSSNAGLTKDGLLNEIQDLQVADGNGHTDNARAAKEAAALVAISCT